MYLLDICTYKNIIPFIKRVKNSQNSFHFLEEAIESEYIVRILFH